MRRKRLIAVAGAVVMLMSACNDGDTPGAEPSPTAGATTDTPEPTSTVRPNPNQRTHESRDRDLEEACDRLFSKRGMPETLTMRLLAALNDLDQSRYERSELSEVLAVNDALSAVWMISPDDFREHVDVIQAPFMEISRANAAGGGSLDLDLSKVADGIEDAMIMCANAGHTVSD